MPKAAKPETIVTMHKPNFDTLVQVFKDGAACLMECTEISTGEKIAVICSCVWDDATEEYVFTPFAKFFNGNPYELLIPPTP